MPPYHDTIFPLATARASDSALVVECRYARVMVTHWSVMVTHCHHTIFPLATGSASDSALAVEYRYARVISASIAVCCMIFFCTPWSGVNICEQQRIYRVKRYLCNKNLKFIFNAIEALQTIVRYYENKLAATLRWFTAEGAIRFAVRQLSQTWKLHYYDVIDDVINRKL